MSSAAHDQRVSFDDVVVDLAARMIERDGVPVSTEPQVFDVLALLIEHRGRVVTKSELLDQVWGDRFVSPATLTSRVRDLRAALGDSGRSQRVIKTAHGRGFQFVAELRPARGFSPPTDAHGRSLKPLVGRADELAEIDRALHRSRLVTLVGPGGVGKTHLVHHAVVDRDAVVVELAHVRDHAALVRSVLTTAGGVERTDVGPTEAALQLLADRDTLLVLDNCEHVLDDVIVVIGDVLRCCPGVRILTTSRRPIHLAEEVLVRIGPLDEGSALELFVAHARRHGVDLSRQLEDRIAAAELCGRLDRLPLALELAATKARAISLTDLLGLLDDRFSTLVATADDTADHHRSLDAAISWSFDLLTPSQADLLVDLAAIVGEFDLDTARAVGRGASTGASVVADLVALVDVSLVTFDPLTGRYGMLESIRVFAERIGVDPLAYDRFRAQLLSEIEQAAPLPIASFSHDVAAIRSRWPGVRAVVARALELGDTATAHRVVAATARFAEQTFSFEVLDWAMAACELDAANGVESPVDTSVATALLLTHRGDFHEAAGHLGRARVTASTAPLGAGTERLRRLAELWHCYFTGDLEGADGAAAALRADPHGEGSYEVIVATIAGQFLDDGAQRPFDQAAIADLEGWASMGDPGVRRGAELCAALRLDRREHADRAVEVLTEIIDDANPSGWAFLASGASTARSLAVSVSPDAESSVRVLRATLRSYAAVGSWQFALADFGAAALAMVRHGRAAAAAELLGARASAGYVGDASNDVADRAASEAQAALGEQRYGDAARHGAARDVKTATRLAIAVFDEIVDTPAV